ncbi:glycoside hydrolase family 88/105 protein [Chryseobacterium profundimaris]|uniref:Rhamnogalacturonyl hydrolase YesR n=1 Tax=Chryseobacterium profundimaris TaxID=1387275 RepID=A0ABY1NP75_9FLAO|nr:glycoside hydrolase family 88 protein [Chryseobacterium profundimaris]SMP14648.1 Rhamnogalacturonyl hydrolase YesR [Chryseobacterium profundimaris]
MKKLLTTGFFALMIAGMTSCSVQKQNKVTNADLPNKKEVLEVAERANRYFMNKWPDPGKEIVGKKVWPSNLWTRAVYYEGLMAIYKVDPKKEYYNYALDWSQKHNWDMMRGTYTRNADNQACGQTYLDLYEIDGKKHPERIKYVKMSMDSMIASGKSDDWWWIDALQMGMPIYSKLGRITGEKKYFDKNYEMYAFTKYKHGGNGLYNPKDKLWWRDKSFVPPYKEPNGEDCYWSRGNGWVVAALARTLEETPKSDPHYQEYLQDYKDLLSALVPIQREDGFWNVSLHDPTNFGGKEMTGTALFVYGMAYGINNNLIDKKTYLPVITKAWNAIVKDSVQPNGFLGWVQGTGKEPKDGQPLSVNKEPDFEDYGLGCLLLAASEVYQLK